ncbi:sensor histidine kinase NtrY-like [Luteithermobacter gelatinilyticus]|uniref:sensor histidine kinase NtrY-like n=1 Tax=Luteithermobacter gelatinilyticus TaxID=2582913 RepID=UPI001106EF8F|nr:PAS domain-containing sensor histidine kinase [Luteithermobacter gelatinilyticus]
MDKAARNMMSEASRTRNARPFFRFALWAKRIKLTNKIAYALALGAFLSGIITYASFSNMGPFAPTPTTLYGLLLFNLVLLLVLGALVSRQMVRLFAAQKAGAAGARLHSRIITLFSIVAITPTIIVAIFSALFFEFGLQSWFSDKVQTVLDNSQRVAEAYIDEHKKVIKADILGMAKDLNTQAFTLSSNPELLEQALTGMAQILSLSEVIVFDRTGQVTARARSTISLMSDPFPLRALESAAEGKVVFLAGKEDDSMIRALVKLDGYLDQFLYISRFIDTRALTLVHQTLSARDDYMRVLQDLSQYRLWFNLTFIVVALLILFAAVWMGLGLANKLMEPIGNLIDTSARVGRGDLSARAPIENTYDDLGGLTKAFNNMTRQLQQQQRALLKANMQLDERRRFTETVLSGVTAGIMGLDPDGTITLPNRSAARLLNTEPRNLKDRRLRDVMPEAAELFEKIRTTKSKSVQDQITINRDDIKLNLLVRITAEMKDKKVEGFVMSFDDITDQVAAQRTAAWADVARRIAHEIKNPLTPIQLAAERLKRKYGRQITSDPAIFTQCTETIIRQVGDLRRMVDEFSSFARMPAPVLKTEDLRQIISQAVFLMEVAHHDIEFVVDLPEEDLKINCDARLIGQALTNLIKNAAEAIEVLREENSAIKGQIRIFIPDGEEGETRVSVMDNGKGLPEELIDRLTEPYVTTRIKGTGLGLAIVKKIMKDHGGDLILVNNKEGGATATLIFASETEAADIASQPKKMRIVHGA